MRQEDLMSTKTKDPICGGMIDPAQSSHKVEYSGFEYYFCSDACLHKFNQSPEQALRKRSPQG